MTRTRNEQILLSGFYQKSGTVADSNLSQPSFHECPHRPAISDCRFKALVYGGCQGRSKRCRIMAWFHDRLTRDRKAPGLHSSFIHTKARNFQESATSACFCRFWMPIANGKGAVSRIWPEVQLVWNGHSSPGQLEYGMACTIPFDAFAFSRLIHRCRREARLRTSCVNVRVEVR